MHSVLSIQLAGLGLALLFQGLLVLSALGISRTYWPLAYLVLFSALASSLALLALVEIPAWEFAILALLAGGAAVGAVKNATVFRGGRPRLTASDWLGWVALAVAVLFAAFPDYRKDQWNYSLVIAKQVAEFGPLTPPILSDHVFFTGTFEYFPILFRSLVHDDTLVQAAANAFSMLTFPVLGIGMVQLFARLFNKRLPSAALLAAFCFYGLGDRSSITNLKPEVLLFFFAAALLYSLLAAVQQPARQARWLMVGVFAILPLSLKVTWVHFLAAVGLGFIAAYRGQAGLFWPRLPAVLAGALLGYLLVLPIHVKNQIFFGNVIHPVQAGFFHSHNWHPAMQAYWDGHMRPAHDLSRYLKLSAANLLNFPQRYFWYLLPLVAGLTMAWRQKPAALFDRADREGMSFLVWSWAAFIGIWPLFFHDAIADRFVIASFALPFVLILLILARTAPRPWLSLVFCLPLLLNSSVEVNLREMAKGWPKTIDRFYADADDSLGVAFYLRQIAAHRRTHGLAGDYNAAIALTDTAPEYFIGSKRVYLGSYEFVALVDELQRQEPGACIAKLLQKLDIQYFFAYSTPFSHWPHDLDKIAARGTAVTTDGAVRFLDRQQLQMLTCAELSQTP